MRISDEQVKKVLSGGKLIREIDQIADGIDDPEFPLDPELVAKVTRDVIAMSDREDRIAEVRAQIESGEYNPSGDEIVEAMVRRAIADGVR